MFEGCCIIFFDVIVFVGGFDDFFIVKFKIGWFIYVVREVYMYFKFIGVFGNVI